MRSSRCALGTKEGEKTKKKKKEREDAPQPLFLCLEALRPRAPHTSLSHTHTLSHAHTLTHTSLLFFVLSLTHTLTQSHSHSHSHSHTLPTLTRAIACWDAPSVCSGERAVNKAPGCGVGGQCPPSTVAVARRIQRACAGVRLSPTFIPTRMHRFPSDHRS